MIASDASVQFLDLLRSAISDATFRRLVLAKPRANAEFNRVTVREVLIRDQVLLSFVESYPTRDITRNVAVPEGIALIGNLIAGTFLRAHLLGVSENIDLSISKKGRAAMHRSSVRRSVEDATVEPTADPLVGVSPVAPELKDQPSVQHDRTKRRFVQQDRPYLVELGVTDTAGRVVPSMAKKWKQINKFIEIVDGAIKSSALSDRDSVSVVDFGSGKGYLTFALHDFLQTGLAKQATVRGVELRADLVDAGNLAVHRAQVSGLAFVCGDIATAITDVPVDIMVALHACDTATDLAVHRGIMAGAEIIVCSPCCHKELRPQMHRPEALAPVLRYGVHLGQEADMVTDTLRALLLEASGYDAKVFEFVGLEHSSKNKMILAVKRAGGGVDRRNRALGEIAVLKSFYGITSQHLETLLAATAPIGIGVPATVPDWAGDSNPVDTTPVTGSCGSRRSD